MRYDVAVIGGGIVGLAVAHELLAHEPRTRLLLLEKEPEVGLHQSGHNAGVLHSGLYYRPGSLKAANCRAGKQRMEAFCQAEDIPFRRCGKVIVAVDAAEVPGLRALQERSTANGVETHWLTADALAEHEPAAAGRAALHVPETGVVDFRAVCRALARRIEARGGTLRTSAGVRGVEAGAAEQVLHTDRGAFAARRIVNCAGLHSDRIARWAGVTPPVRIVPFRGQFYEITPPAADRIAALVYPVPDPRMPFLGVHVTRMIDDRVECGPNAVLALAREGYARGDVQPRDLAGLLAWPGFYRLAGRHARAGALELWRSLGRRRFLPWAQRLVPALTAADLGNVRTGVRAQAVAPNGALVDDFVVERRAHGVHVLNAPSPAATAALEIARRIREHLET